MSHWEYGTIGEILKKRRESKNLSLDEAAAATNISIRFLSALEENQFSKLPGQIHITGFVRLYGHYLELEENLLMEKLNRQMMMDEQPPLEEIMALAKQVQPKNKKINPAFIVLMLIVVASISIVAIYFSQNPASDPKKDEQTQIWDQDLTLKKGSVLEIPYEKDLIVFKLMEISSDMITLAPEKEQGAIHYVRKNEYLRYDYNDDYFFDLEITVKNIESSKVLLSVRKLKELRLKDQDNYSIGLAGDLKTQAQDETSNPRPSETALVAVARNIKDFSTLIWAVDASKEGKEEMIRLQPGKTLELKILENQALKIQSIEASDLSAIELQVGERTFKFEKARGAAGYIQFEMKEENGQKKLSWQAVY